MKTLRQLHLENRGKVSDKWASYLDVYERHLGPYRNRNIRLLEIGVQNGGSLETWNRYFTRAKLILGCDIDPKCRDLTFRTKKTRLVVADANSPEGFAQISAHSQAFDLIFDDGSHRTDDIIRSFFRYFPMLADDGLFIIEDLHCSYWKSHAGGFIDSPSAMELLKRLADLVNRDHWASTASVTQLLGPFTQPLGITFKEEDFASIASVTFTDSLCIIHKSVALAGLRERLVSGQQALVNAAPLGANQQIMPKTVQTEPWLEPLSVRELPAVRQQLHDTTQDLHQARQDNDNMVNKLNAMQNHWLWRLKRQILGGD